MASRVSAWFKKLSKTSKVLVVTGTTLTGLTAIGMASPAPPPTPATNQSITTAPTSNVAPSIPVTEIKTETSQESVPFSARTINDSTMLRGSSKVTINGVNGVKTKKWDVTYTDSKETKRVLTSEAVTVKPVDQITSIGVKSPPTIETNCSNGSYVNSAGNTVCRPHEASSAPSGASAQCRDGTYSYSQSRRGTCSHHGGVATWL